MTLMLILTESASNGMEWNGNAMDDGNDSDYDSIFILFISSMFLSFKKMEYFQNKKCGKM